MRPRPPWVRTPVTCISNHGRPWQGRGSLPTGRPNPIQSLQRSRRKQDACASILSRTAAACGKAAGPALHAWSTGRPKQGRRRRSDPSRLAHRFPSTGRAARSQSTPMAIIVHVNPLPNIAPNSLQVMPSRFISLTSKPCILHNSRKLRGRPC